MKTFAAILEIVKNISKPMSMLWARKEQEKKFKKKLERIEDADNRRRSADELRKKWKEAQGEAKKKALQEYLDFIGHIAD